MNIFKYGAYLNDFLSFDNEEEKKLLINQNISYDLCRTLKMFKYENLPDTIPCRDFELLLQTHGFACVTKVNEELYAFFGGLGGKPNEYYMPTICIVNNPYLKFNKELKIDEDCVIVNNDSLYMGLLPLLRKYNSLIVENEFSMNMVDILSRITSLVSASDDETKASAELFFKKLRDGNFSIIGDNAFLESLKTLPTAATSNNALIPLIEYEQYLKVSKYNELGLNGNYNMKRESINSNEAQLNDDFLKPFIDDMFESRQKAIEKINEMFGTNIKISKNSSWEDMEIEENLEHEAMVYSIETDDADVETDDADVETDDVESDDVDDVVEVLEEVIEEVEEVIEEIEGGEEDEEIDYIE